ncbi:hypothetical protein ACLB2K_006378 [Fragaria x ananassa]
MSMKPRDIQIKMQSAYGFEISYKYMSIALLARLFTKGPSFVQLEGLEIKDSLESQGRVVTFMSDHSNGSLGSFKKFAEEREMPAYGMLDQTRIKLMNQMGERRDEAQLWTTPLTPRMQDRLKERTDAAA